MTSSTLIDVMLYSDHDLHERTIVLDCPFSDHSFVASSLKIAEVKLEVPSVMGRNLSEPILDQIRLDLDSLELRISDRHNFDQNWIHIKQQIMSVINKHAPIQAKASQEHKPISMDREGIDYRREAT